MISKKILLLHYLSCLLFFIGCNNTENTNVKTTKKTASKPIVIADKKNKIIYLQPLGKVEISRMNEVKEAVEKFFNFNCNIQKVIPLTEDIKTNDKRRYNANKILKKFNSQNNLLLITNEDIAEERKGQSDWGVFGLGYRPGTTAVISTFRMKKNVTEEKILERLKKVAIHEIGHNLGLDHCVNHPECLMHAAEGTIKQVDREKIWFCERCVKLLQR